ncbi:D-alanyl-D-alanine carboxypeptidase/D-alanyl-D-alanine endopeptidase [Segniliparus rugosus]|uniref:D-alanyl-D-alanine carboxypeptidase/D-alanyl-D-alanine-endopeptidase n=1 Tax=Segniliparus rugosus (strain ATCC BAA-974 / DSM 45345 / CCUG 50838 / CIP 108380 / JCM 13579 / CDC 945) TaxID=679197 RepID=E5XQR8_SEGRC|nr:D-alanyl-D-alanine carboxypeptidase/D-alanyl-D-alanine-endopeptidase [Segniliparus rugosus]EFV13329.2 D-alanyl-D-alanine carboxypeptidase/D-alanyl-D-alanine-endopeptidase [Segniliparus rugosus ATCC BAA-974]
MARRQSSRTPRARHRPRRVWAALAVAVLTVGGGGAWGLHAYESAKAQASAQADSPPLVVPRPQILPVSPDAPSPTAAGVAAALDPLGENPVLARFSGVVLDGASGQVLWQRDADAAMTPASTMKLVTAASAVASLPLDGRLATRVVAGSVPGQVVIVGAGDPTLSAASEGEKPFYADAPRLDDLVAQVRQRHPGPVDEVLVDESAYQGPDFGQGWLPEDIAGGFITPMQPLMLDGGRLDRSRDESPRTPTPALDAGKELARRLGADPDRTRAGTAPPGAAELAKVLSAPLRERILQFMLASDNVLAEAVGREVARGAGKPASFDGAVEAEREVLGKAGLDLSSAQRLDSNGLSLDDRVSASVLARLVGLATGRAEALRPLLDLLPVAGATGTLYERFSDPISGKETAGAGWVRAKTGSLDNVATLAGATSDQDGRMLVFAFMSNDGATWDTRAALDALASALRGCGCK